MAKDKPKKTRLKLQASSKKRNKNLAEDEHDHEPVLNMKSKKRINSKKRVNSKKQITPKKPLNKLINKMAREPEVSSTMKNNLPEEDELLDEHDHKTVLNVNSKKLKTNDGNKGIETRKSPIGPKASFRDDDPWYDHDHDKCIAEQLRLDFDAPIPAYYAKYFSDQVSQSPDEPFILSGSELDRYSPFHTPPREVTPLSEQYQLLTNDALFLPSRRDLTDLGSNDDLGDQGPMTRSKRKKLLDEFYKEAEIEMELVSDQYKSMEEKFIGEPAARV